MRSLEQRDTERLLDRRDLARERRLRQVQLGRRASERQQAPGRLEAAQEVEGRQPAERLMHDPDACESCRMIV